MRPDSDSFVIKSVKIQGIHDFVIGNVSVLGNSNIRNIHRNEQGLSILLDKKPASDKPICFKIEII